MRVQKDVELLQHLHVLLHALGVGLVGSAHQTRQ